MTQAKRITQESFDDVVKENMEEFDMEREEAVQDAIEQFKAQGVDLSNINTSTSEEQPPILKALDAIKAHKDCLDKAELPDNDGLAELMGALDLVSSECTGGQEIRALFGGNDGVGNVVRACRMFAVNNRYEELVKSLVTLASAIKTRDNRDFFASDKGVELLFEIFKRSEREDVTRAACGVIRVACVKHESNRQKWVSGGICIELVKAMEKYMDNGPALKDITAAMRAFTMNEDERENFSKAHDHAREFHAAGAVPMLIKGLRTYSKDVDVAAELVNGIARIAVKDEIVKDVINFDGIKLIYAAWDEHKENPVFSRNVLAALWNMSYEDLVKQLVASSGGAERIVAAMTMHIDNASVQEQGCGALATIMLRLPGNVELCVKAGGIAACIEAMKNHPESAGVNRQACQGLRNFVSRNKENIEKVLVDPDTEMLIRKAGMKHPVVNEAAWAALRDLHLKVELQERWTSVPEHLKNKV